MFTEEMFAPIVTAVNGDMPVLIKVAVSIMATPFAARKLFGVFYSLAG